MTTGITISEIKKEIRAIFTGQGDIHSVFGFGSYFRGEPYEDVDVLFVLKSTCESLLPVYYSLQADMLLLGSRWNILIDLTVLTFDEFLARPLRDMDSLINLSD